MICVKCGKEIPEGAAFCPHCGEKVIRGCSDQDVPLYQADVKMLLKSGKLIVYRDRTEFITNRIQKATYTYTGLVSVKKNLSNNIDFIMEDGYTETCPADRKCVHEALVYIRQAVETYLAQRKERLLSQGIRYSFPSNQGLMNNGILNISSEQAEFKAKSGKTDVVSYRDVKAVSACSGTLDFKLYGGGTKSYAVSDELRDEVLAFVTDSVALFLAQRKEELLAQGIYFSSHGLDGGILDIYSDRAEYKDQSGQVESCILFQDIRMASLYSGTLELALTDGTLRTFPIDDDIANDILDFVKSAMEPYVAARTVGFDTVFGVDEQIEFNDERSVFHLIRQGGREITTEWPREDLLRCEWTENKKLTVLGSVVSGSIGLFKSVAAGGRTGAEAEGKIGSIDVVLTIGGENQSVCFGRSSIGMSRTDKKYIQCLTEWDKLSEYLQACCPECELIDPVIPEPEPEPPEPLESNALPEHEEAEASEDTENADAVGADDVPASPDTAAQQDDLGIAKYIEGVYRFIGNCETPMTIAFQGNWGSGKNSALGMLFNRMEDEYSGNLFWFNAQDLIISESGDARSALVDKVRAEQSDEGIQKQVGNFLTILAALTTGIFADDSDLGREIVNSLLNRNPSDQQESLVTVFSKQVKEKIQGENGKIVIFIDGLNRLVPAKAVDLLEAMRDFFECKGCVFVVSANYADILHSAQERYDGNKARHFLDGIFKMTFQVPASSLNVKGYTKGKLENLEIQTEDDAELELYTELIQHSIGKDKETIDRLFTSYRLFKDMTDGDIFQDRYKRLIMFALLCMQMQFPDAYHYAIERRDNATPEFLATLCGASEQPWNTSQTDDEMASYRDFGSILAQIVNQDSRPEISQAECQAFAEALKLSRVTSRFNS